MTRAPGDRDDPESQVRRAETRGSCQERPRVESSRFAPVPGEVKKIERSRRNRGCGALERPWLIAVRRRRARSARRSWLAIGGAVPDASSRPAAALAGRGQKADRGDGRRARTGKSTTAATTPTCRLSAALACCSSMRTLGSPVQHEIFGISRSPGLVEFVASPRLARELVQRVSAQLHVLTAGQPVARASDVVHSRESADLLQQASEAYDVVVLDTSPVLATADAEAIAAHVGVQVVFVVDDASRRRRRGQGASSGSS